MEYEIRNMRIKIGAFLHDYYVKFGASKYDYLVEEMGRKMSQDYGEPFNSENLRIMEVEYVMLNEKIKPNNKKITS